MSRNLLYLCMCLLAEANEENAHLHEYLVHPPLTCRQLKFIFNRGFIIFDFFPHYIYSLLPRQSKVAPVPNHHVMEM